MNCKVKKAVFPVAGMGTRFLPATKSIPKEILTLVDRPLIQYAIDEARSAGIEDFIFVTARGKSSLEDYFDNAPELESRLQSSGKTALLDILKKTDMPSGAISYVRQAEALGLGHAVNCARRLIGNEPFAVILTDDIIQTNGPSALQQMVQEYEKQGGGYMVATMEVAPSEVSSYGVIDPVSKQGRFVPARGLVEKPAAKDAPSNYAVIGRYILQPEIFNYLNQGHLGAGGEIQLTDAIDHIAKTEGNVGGFLFDGLRYDCGSKLGYLKATVAFGLSNPELSDGFRDHLKSIINEL